MARLARDTVSIVSVRTGYGICPRAMSPRSKPVSISAVRGGASLVQQVAGSEGAGCGGCFSFQCPEPFALARPAAVQVPPRHRDLVDTPAFFELLPRVDGLVCLDLGCGEGHNTRLLAGKRARVAALDVAESFITAAAGHDRDGICHVVGDGAALPLCASAFDAVAAFMSLMDVAEPEFCIRSYRRRTGAGSTTSPVYARHRSSAITFTRARSPRPGPSAPHRQRHGSGTRRKIQPPPRPNMRPAQNRTFGSPRWTMMEADECGWWLLLSPHG